MNTSKTISHYRIVSLSLSLLLSLLFINILMVIIIIRDTNNDALKATIQSRRIILKHILQACKSVDYLEQ